MRIGIFLYTFNNGSGGGVQQYIERVIEGLTLHSTDQIILFCSSNNSEYLKRFIKNKNGDIVVIKQTTKIIPLRYLNNAIKEFYILFKAVGLDDLYMSFIKKIYSFKFLKQFLFKQGDYKVWIEKYVDIIYFPYPYLNRYDLEVPSIITTHDIQHKIMPENFSKKSIKKRDKYYKSSAERSNGILVSYNHVKKDIIKYYKIQENKIYVCREGFEINNSYRNHIKSIAPKVVESFNLPEKYMIYPAAPSHHKNHTILIEAMNILKNKYDMPIHLVITGKKDVSIYLKKIEESIELYGMEDFVTFTGFIDSDQLYSLMIQSALVIVPTLYESGSLPVDEAICLEAPVLASNVTALPQQVGDNRFIFDPYNAKDIADKVYKIINDEFFRNENILNSSNQKKELSWAVTIKSFLNAFKSVYNNYHRQ